ncbi:MAG: sigma-70 family RNA polymerase sigma factor [Chloroflexi bacterium]|jgi:RNA polymerase sigma-70 factor (ECF subfamily)|nr:sigma-70 family RNA polymerase sigma factor [Chloroflexota bacterium]
MHEEQWIAAARRGDVEAFNRLVLRYQDLAYTVAYRITGDAATASDATQEAFISAFKKLNQFRGDRFKPWLMRIVTNACYDELRRAQRRPAASLDDLYENVGEPDGTLNSTPESPEAFAQRSELSAAIQDCISALPDDQRVIAVLADVEDYAYADIATITDLPLGTVKSRLSRARGRLRDCLRGLGELLPAEFRLVDEEK